MSLQLPPVGKIKEFFPKHRVCLVKVLLLLLECILQSRTVNLNKCKSKVGQSVGQKKVKQPNVYTRFIRLFKMQHVDSFCFGITMLILSMMQLSGTINLVIDRTNWEIGKAKINVLCLGFLLPNGIFIPVIWEVLPKKGNSNEKERIALLKRFQKAWPGSVKHKFILLGDREFIGLEWFGWLFSNQLSFVIRLRWQDYFGLVADACGTTTPKLERKIRRKVKRNGFFQASITVEGHIFYFTVLPNTAKRRVKAKPNPGDDFVVLLSPIKKVEQVSLNYRKRWGIEVFFRHAKKNGFNLEDLNLKKKEKVQLMVGIVAIAYCLSIMEGLKQESENPPKIKKHGAKEVSTFRNGFDNVQSMVHNLKDLIQFLLNLILYSYDKLRIQLKSV